MKIESTGIYRHNQHNKYYWVVLNLIALEMNKKGESKFNPYELHKLFKNLYNLETTTKLSPEDFLTYVEFCIDNSIKNFEVNPNIFDDANRLKEQTCSI